MDYGKYKYELSRKTVPKPNSTSPSSRKFACGPKTGEHDIETKINQIRRFLEHHDKVQVTVQFRGREMQTRRGRPAGLATRAGKSAGPRETGNASLSSKGGPAWWPCSLPKVDGGTSRCTACIIVASRRNSWPDGWYIIQASRRKSAEFLRIRDPMGLDELCRGTGLKPCCTEGLKCRSRKLTRGAKKRFKGHRYGQGNAAEMRPPATCSATKRSKRKRQLRRPLGSGRRCYRPPRLPQRLD
jgi:hypothetical protein